MAKKGVLRRITKAGLEKLLEWKAGYNSWRIQREERKWKSWAQIVDVLFVAVRGKRHKNVAACGAQNKALLFSLLIWEKKSIYIMEKESIIREYLNIFKGILYDMKSWERECATYNSSRMGIDKTIPLIT